MSFKIVLLCAQICLIKTAVSQCFGPRPAPVGEASRFSSPLLLENYPMPAPGLSIAADDLLIEGMVTVCGSLPFLGTVAIEGVLPTEGHGSVMYGCGNGEVRITAENGYGPGLVGAETIGPMAGPMAGPIGGPLGPAAPLARGPGPAIETGLPAAKGFRALAGF